MAGQTINVAILADTKQFSSEMSKLSGDSGMGRIGSTAKRMGSVVAAGMATAGVALAGLAAKTVGLASDLEQSMGGVDAVFKGVAGQVHTFATQAAGSLGLSKNSYNELATIIGTTLKNSGTAMDKLAGTTNTLIGRSADLAATFGGPVTEASAAMASALRGEFEPLRRYGVSLNQADINARALADTGKTNAAALTKQEKALAAQALIMDQSKDAAGAFARESGTLAGQTERLKANLENLGARVGSVLLPPLTAITTWIVSEGLPKLEALGRWAADTFGPAFSSIGSVLATVGSALRDFFGSLSANEGESGGFISGILTAFEQLKTAVEQAFAVVAPIAAQVFEVFKSVFGGDSQGGGIGGLIRQAASLVTTYISYMATVLGAGVTVIKGIWNQFGPAILAVVRTAFETIKTVISSVMNIVQGIIRAVTALIKGDWSAAWQAIKDTLAAVWGGIKALITGALSIIKTVMASAWEAIKGVLSRAWEGIKGKISEGIESAVSTVKSLPGKAKDALSNIGTTLLDAGRNLIQGFIDGIGDMIGSVQSTLSDLTNKLTDWKGPAARDRTLLHGAGRMVIGGFIAGMESQYGAVRGSLNSLTTSVGGASLDPLTVAPGSLSQAATAGPTNVDRSLHVTAHGLDARAVVREFKAQQAMDAALNPIYA